MERLIVPLDGSRFGEHGPPRALLLAHRSGAVPGHVADNVVRGSDVPVLAGRAP